MHADCVYRWQAADGACVWDWTRAGPHALAQKQACMLVRALTTRELAAHAAQHLPVRDYNHPAAVPRAPASRTSRRRHARAVAPSVRRSQPSLVDLRHRATHLSWRWQVWARLRAHSCTFVSTVEMRSVTQAVYSSCTSIDFRIITQLWGESYPQSELVVSWHVPSRAEQELAQHLVQRYVPKCLDALTGLMRSERELTKYEHMNLLIYTRALI